MGFKVLILGESGTGKSASMRNFKNDEVLLINVANKLLPFKQKGGKFETLSTDDYFKIKQAIKKTDKKVIVIDDAQYLMANEFMRRATEKGFDKFTEIAQNYWELCQAIDNISNDKIVYILSHVERDQNGNEKAKTIGKLLDEKITIEGLYTIVLKTLIQDGKYYFQTQNNGADTCKSPMGLFDTYLIENDLKAVDSAIRDYYDFTPQPSVQTTSVDPTEVEESPEMISLAEKLAKEITPNEPPKRERAVQEPKVETALPHRKERSFEDKVNEFTETPTRTRTRRRIAE